MSCIKYLCLLILYFPLLACHWLSAARIVTQQGNILTTQQLHHLKIGMSKTEVAIYLGNSLISSNFQNDRWDYSSTWQKGEGPLMIKRCSLFFKNERLVRIKIKPFE